MAESISAANIFRGNRVSDPTIQAEMSVGTDGQIRAWIEDTFEREDYESSDDGLAMLAAFRQKLNDGRIRAAEPVKGHWRACAWVKKGVYLHRSLGTLMPAEAGCFELDTLPRRTVSRIEDVRVPSTATVIRDGVYLAGGVSCMPPSFVNIGAWIGRDTVLDSHVLVGACAQIGEHVRIGCGAQVGGHIQPVESLPVIIGDDVVVGGQCGIYDGATIGDGAILCAGTMLTAQTRVYDAVRKQIYTALADRPLVIPPMAIVMPGARQLSKGRCKGSGLLVHVPVIIGYRDETSLSGSLLDEFMD
jgi:2,3,4,5-tetrahydropyridine-2-carboxylate N-succinyltransferase